MSSSVIYADMLPNRVKCLRCIISSEITLIYAREQYSAIARISYGDSVLVSVMFQYHS